MPYKSIWVSVYVIITHRLTFACLSGKGCDSLVAALSYIMKIPRVKMVCQCLIWITGMLIREQ